MGSESCDHTSQMPKASTGRKDNERDRPSPMENAAPVFFLNAEIQDARDELLGLSRNKATRGRRPL